MNMNRILGRILLMGLFLIVVGCETNPRPLWAKKGPLIEKYGMQFMEQNKLLDVTRRGDGVCSFLTNERIIISTNFMRNEYEIETDEKVAKKSLDEIKSEFGLRRETLKYWASALDELDSYLISKDELYCDIHMSEYSSAPLGASSMGWFYFSERNKAEPSQGFARLLKMKDGWYWGITKRLDNP